VDELGLLEGNFMGIPEGAFVGRFDGTPDGPALG